MRMGLQIAERRIHGLEVDVSQELPTWEIDEVSGLQILGFLLTLLEPQEAEAIGLHK